jgi:DNA topoisomerase I
MTKNLKIIQGNQNNEVSKPDLSQLSRSNAENNMKKTSKNNSKKDNQKISLKELKVGDQLDLSKLIYTQKFTQPPSRYSAASLIKKLEEQGIGRPSTYATIISTLQDRGYVEGKGNSMKPTTLGMKVSKLLKENFTDVTGSTMTAEMEDNLDKIAGGDKTYIDVLKSFWGEFKEEIETKTPGLKENRTKYKTSETDILCPKCGSQMELKIGRFGEYYQCLAFREHQFPKNFREYEKALAEAQAKYTHQAEGKKCEVCGKDLIVRASKSSLKPYIACPEYKVGNKHTVMNIDLKDIKEG